MKLVIIGASGNIGGCILNEALRRGHIVTATARDSKRIKPSQHANLNVESCDAAEVKKTIEILRGHDALISAIGPREGEPAETVIEIAKKLIEAVSKAGISRLIFISGAGSLEAAPGMLLLDTPDFPPAWRPIADAHRKALEIFRRVTDLAWTVISPAALIEPGKRTGNYRIGKDKLIVDKQGESRISTQDFSVAVLDEIETPEFIRQRMTVAY